MRNMWRVLLMAVCVLVSLGDGLRLPSSADMLESLEQRIGVRISNTENEIEAKISNMEDEIKVETKQLRKEVLRIYENLIDFEEKIKLLLSDQKAGKQDAEQIEDKTGDDAEQNEERFKRIDTRISEMETDLKKEKELQQDIMEAVKTVTTAVSLMSDDNGEIRDGIKSVKETVRGSEAKIAEIKTTLESVKQNLDVSQKYIFEINSTLETLKQTTAEVSDDIAHIKNRQSYVKQTIDDNKEGIVSVGQAVSALGKALTDLDDELNKKCYDQISISENRLEKEIDNIESIIQNLTVKSSESFGEVNETTKQVQNQCKKIEDVQQSLHLELKDDLENMQLFLNDTANKCLSRVESAQSSPAAPSTISPGRTVHSSCRDGVTTSGVYKIKLPGASAFDAYCDMETDGGGWLVFQRRKDGSVDFYRNWQEYKEGFGNLYGEFWLGNDIIHNLTSSAFNELRIDLWDWHCTTAYAKYSTFSIGSEWDKYRLRIGEFSGTAGDSIINSANRKHNADNELFSTKDQDNDSWGDGACAVPLHGAWWYKSCTYSCLNGRYYPQPKFKAEVQSGVLWYEWKKTQYSLKGSEMKIRPKY